MELLRWKTRLAVLWIILAVNFSAYLFLSLFGSGNLMEWLETPSTESAGSIGVLFLIPFIMAWLSMTLKDSTNRWTNFVLGVLNIVFFVVQFIQHAAAGRSVAMLINVFLALIMAILISWYAWKWPKQEA